jgi:hypothetical protein
MQPMGETTGPAVQSAPQAQPAARRWLGLTAVHLAMVIAALLGIGWTSLSGPPEAGGGRSVVWVWLALVPAYCAACIWEGWAHATASRLRTRLVVTQVLHWAAFLVAMYMLLTPQARSVLNDNAVGLALLTLLAMGTFVAGVHAWSLPVCATGVVLALAVPAIAWVDANMMVILVGLLLAALVAAAVLLVRRRMTAG